MKKTVSGLIVMSLMLAGLLLIRCKIDHGLKPINSKITGNIYFQGEIPRHTDEVRVAVVTEFPPSSINELLFSDALRFRSSEFNLITPVEWEIFLPPGKYEVIAVVWKERNQSWNISDIIGVYGGSFAGDLLIPTYQSVEVPSSQSVVRHLDITANLNRVNRDTEISGTITFTGTWPSNTGVVGIGAFTDIPVPGDVMDYFFKNVALDYTIPTRVSETGYRLRVRSQDVLKYIAVMWIDDSYSMASITDIGHYKDPANPDQPGVVRVAQDPLTGLDISVDFSEMEAAQ